MSQYEIIVGNVGTVCRTCNGTAAVKAYNEQVENSKAAFGRAAGEPVTMMRDGEPTREYHPPVKEEA